MATIEDGTGTGRRVGVNEENRLQASVVSQELQAHIAYHDEENYQVIGTASLSSGTTVCLHIKNTSAVDDMVIFFIRHQVVDQAGGTALPNASNYFSIAYGRTYGSGGSAVTPVNTVAGSLRTATATCYASGPTLAGTASELDRWYTQAEADMNTFAKYGALLLRPTQTAEFRYVGDQSSGTIYTRVTFSMVSSGHRA